MERLGAWLWRRHRRRFVGWVALTTGLLLFPALGIAATIVGSIYLGLGTGDILVWSASLVGGVAVGFVAVRVSVRHTLVPIQRWLAGDESDLAAAWLALVRMPQLAARRAFLVGSPLILLTSYPVAYALADPDAVQAVALAIAYPYVTAGGALLIATSLQLMVRPAADDVAERGGLAANIETSTDDGGAWSIRFRLVAVAVFTTGAGGLVMSALVVGDGASSGDYLLAILGSAAFGAYMGWIIDTALVGPILRPLQDVISATGRVRRGELTTPVPVSSLDELGDLTAAFNQMQRGLQERESLHAAFGSYVDPALARRLVESGSSVFEGEDVEVTVLFADVRDFTAFAEGVTPGAAVERLNRLFDVIVPVLHDHRGHANHYLGDGLLAVFGAPEHLDGHADAAVAAALEIRRRVGATFGDELRLGIGINTGPVIAGTIGGGGRHEFTVIGDTVNVAARVEQLTKETGDAILLTDATRRALTPPRPRSTKRGAFDLKGKSAGVTVHAV